MATVSRNVVIIGTTERDGAHSYRLLTDVKMQETTDPPGIVIFQCRLLETANANHRGEQFDLFLYRKRTINRRCGEVQTIETRGSK